MIKNFIFLTGIFFISFSCIPKETSQTYEPEKLESYYRIINRAELSIIDSDYDKALSQYKKAFDVIDQPYSRDVYNAALAAAILGHEEYALEQIKFLIQIGIPPERISSIKFFEKILNENRGFLTVSKLKTINEDLSAELWEMHEKDQLFRRNDRDFEVSHQDTIQAIDRKNIQELNENFEQYGYPNEGIVSPNDIGIMWNLPQDIIITHALQKGDTSLVSDLNLALDKGQIHPLKYSIFIDYIEKSFAGKYASVAFYKRDSTIHKEYTAEQEDYLNMRRAEIGLEPLKDYNRKALFMQFKNHENFILGVRYAHWFIEDLPPMPID